MVLNSTSLAGSFLVGGAEQQPAAQQSVSLTMAAKVQVKSKLTCQLTALIALVTMALLKGHVQFDVAASFAPEQHSANCHPHRPLQ